LVWRPTYGELKRFFVLPDIRRLGVGRRLVNAVVQEARGLGCVILRLETGIRQPEAVALYESFGFQKIGTPFGEYNDSALSIFMEKQL